MMPNSTRAAPGTVKQGRMRSRHWTWIVPFYPPFSLDFVRTAAGLHEATTASSSSTGHTASGGGAMW